MRESGDEQMAFLGCLKNLSLIRLRAQLHNQRIMFVLTETNGLLAYGLSVELQMADNLEAFDTVIEHC